MESDESQHMMKMVIALVLAQVLVSVLRAQVQRLDQIHVLTLVGRPLALIVGEKRGTFAKNGIEVVTENFASSDLIRTALAEGKGDLAYAAVDNAVAMVDVPSSYEYGYRSARCIFLCRPPLHGIRGVADRSWPPWLISQIYPR